MRERRGPLGRTVGALTSSLADAARGRQTRADQRVIVHDSAGHSRLLDPAGPEHAQLVETAEALLELIGGPPAED
jgi:hypothetical protein